jgi:hypothetical protein
MVIFETRAKPSLSVKSWALQKKHMKFRHGIIACRHDLPALFIDLLKLSVKDSPVSTLISGLRKRASVKVGEMSVHKRVGFASSPEGL